MVYSWSFCASNATNEAYDDEQLCFIHSLLAFQRGPRSSLGFCPTSWWPVLGAARRHTAPPCGHSRSRRPAANSARTEAGRRGREPSLPSPGTWSRTPPGSEHNLEVRNGRFGVLTPMEMFPDGSGRWDAASTLCGQSLDSLPAVTWAGGCGAVERPLCTCVYRETTEASSSL